MTNTIRSYAGAAGIALLMLLNQACNYKAGDTGIAKRSSFLDISEIDSSIQPGDDFFTYMNGKWIAKTKIPDDQSGWGSFYNVEEENLAKTKVLLDGLAKTSGSKGSAEQKIGDFYASGMDTTTIEQRGIEPIKASIAKIEALTDFKSYIQYVSTNAENFGGQLIGFGVSADEKNSNKNFVQLSQAGTSLPEKDYYTKQDEQSVKIRNAWFAYCAKLFVLSGTDSAKAKQIAQDIFAFESKLAAVHKSPVELRDPVANYKKFAVSELKSVYNMDWAGFFKSVGLETDSVIMGQPKYYSTVLKLIQATPIETIKNIEKYGLLDGRGSLLTKAFADARQEYYGKALSGNDKQQERWKKIANATDNNLGELMGQVWVKKYFTEAAKKRMTELVSNLKKVYRSRIEKLDWMSAETKAKALVKFDRIIDKIGYPDTWQNYDDVSIDKTKYYENVMSARLHGYNKMCADLKKPVDKKEWGMTPPTVNAYANPVYNEIVFPAGILQFPFFDNNADDAINYGGIGMVIGHEMTHLFDDQGRQYDADGNLAEWWTKTDAELFNKKTKAVVDQYNGFTMFGNMHVNGELTLGENLADLGGIAIAYEAFKLTEQGKGMAKIDGLTPDQRFFMSFAQIWRIKNRDETMKVRLTTDPHSPEMFRINGPLSNFGPWYTAFNVTEKNKMWIAPEKRAGVW
jgi:putative endopeptidase